MSSSDDMQSPGPLMDGPSDPEHHPAAAWALEPRETARLTRRIVATSGRSQVVHTPVTGAPLVEIPQSSPADVEAAFERARTAQGVWALTPMAERSAILLAFHDLVLARQSEIVDLIVWESAKARKHAFDEPLHLALTARWYARKGPGILARSRPGGVIPLLASVTVDRHPKGVVGVISPWNYPFTMALCDALPALLAGNAVVIKPDAQSMLSALLGAELLEQAGLPAGLFSVVAGPGAEVGAHLVQRADYIAFTGSTATGKSIAQGCAERLIGCSLELGGKNPMVIRADAQVARAVEGAVRAVFSNSGQLCVSVERLFVHEAIHDRFVSAFVQAVESMKLGASLEWGLDMGPLISQAQLDRVSAQVADAVARGATVLTGAHPRPDIGPYGYAPTVLTDVTEEMELYAQETFGPVVSIYRVADDVEAIRRANEGDYGLNASIYSRDVAGARAMAAQITAGTVNINEAFGATFATIGAPMGGMRSSGMGRRQGSEGILRYTEAQSVATLRLMRLAPMGPMSDKTYADLMVTGLRVLKKLGRA